MSRIIVALVFFVAGDTCAALHVTSTALASHQRQFDTRSGDAVHLKWIHPAKTGTSFVNVLMTYSCVNLSDDAWAGDDEIHNSSFKALMETCGGHWDMCGDLFHGHRPVGYDLCTTPTTPHSKELVAMFRQPEQRLLSRWFFENSHWNNSEPTAPDFDPNETPLEMAMRIQGCYVRMLIHVECDERDPDADPKVDLATAKERLHDQFAFVGLTEHWAASVCLFHSMLGGECHRREFYDVNLGTTSHSSSGYDVEGPLGNWTDVYDGLLYKEASFIFWSHVGKYGVSMESCADVICAAAADAFLNMSAPLEFEHEPLWALASDESEGVDNVFDEEVCVNDQR